MLVAALAPRLSPSARAEIEEFIEVKECGLALETLVDALAKDGWPIPVAEPTGIGQLAAAMRYPAEMLGRLEQLADPLLARR